jgi:hypothetical protein
MGDGMVASHKSLDIVNIRDRTKFNPEVWDMDNGANASYYELHGNPKRLQDLLVGMTWNQGNAFKAIWRWDKKGAPSGKPSDNLVYNLEKAQFFIQEELNQLYAAIPSNPRGNADESQLRSGPG